MIDQTVIQRNILLLQRVESFRKKKTLFLPPNECRCNSRGSLKHPGNEGDNKLSYNAPVKHTGALTGLQLKSSYLGLSQKKYTCTLGRR